MVAIVVVLAATISVFVLGLGQNLSDNGPSVSFVTEEQGNNIIIIHRGGDRVSTANLNIKGAAKWSASNTEIAAGDRITIVPDSGAEEVIVVWNKEDTSTILTTVQIDFSNLILNPTFVSGSGSDADFWEQDDTAGGAERSSDRALVGSYSMRQNQFISDYSRFFTSDPVDVSGGQTYEFGGSYYLEATNDKPEDYEYYITITWLDGDGNEVGKDPPDSVGGSEFQAFNEWTETEIKNAPYSAPADAEQADLKIRSRDNGYEDTDVYWDDIFIEAAND